MALHDRIFASVFPPPSEVDIPTPAATPVLGSSGFGEAFGSQHLSQPPIENSAAEQIKWDRAWHTATAYLTLPSEPINADQDEKTLRVKWIKSVTPEIERALTYILSEDSRGRQIRKANNSDDLLRWYFEEVVLEHWIQHALPRLIKILGKGDVPEPLFELGQELFLIQLIYLQPLKEPISQILGDMGKAESQRFEADLHGLFTRTLPQALVSENLTAFLTQQCSLILGDENGAEIPNKPPGQVVRQRTLQFMRNLQSVGLSGYQAQRIFAEVMSETLTTHVKVTCKDQWSSPSAIVEQLQHWVENRFARFVVEMLASMRDQKAATADNLTRVTHSDVERWQDMGVNKLGALRTDELFSIVVDWDDSRGAIEDLKRYVTVPASRTYLTNTFSNVVAHRLLQPGASTTEILQVYISIIRAFTVLDPKGVLLDRVARPIRRYLRERDDTVTIVVGGLLADPDDDASSGDALLELAVEMSKNNSLKGEDDAEDGELDFDDMNWMPDPVDAGPEYKKSKNSDVIGSLISLFDSKDVFVKEFQKILGERLLKNEYDFDREIRVLELLKIRFGESALQACEVMLRDILDSRRVDTFIHIHKDKLLDLDDESAPALHTRILSHLFWPSLHSETFLIPPEITSLQSRYSTGFETLKQSRKLTWLHALGQVTVTLDLEDRTVSEEVQTWQASVIYAFQPTEAEDLSIPVTRTFDELLETLEMTEALLHNALTFWIGKLVLKQISTSPSTYVVLETLSDEDAAQEGTTSAAIAAAAETATAAAAPAVLSEHEVAQEKMEIYSQYVVGMLTNGGPMPLQQIVMMLKLTVPGGFPFGNEELKSFLEGEVREGKLDFAGGTYKIKH